MKRQLLFPLLLTVILSCTESGSATTEQSPAQEVSSAENLGPSDGISDYTRNKKSFMLTCNIDGRLALGGDKATDEQVSQFCECVWEKTNGRYENRVMANNSALEKHPVLKECFENAKAK